MSEVLPIIQSPFNKARIDKFVLVVNIPEQVKKINSKVNRTNKNIQLDTLQFSVWGAVVPPISVPAVNMRYGGGNMPISSHSRPEWPPLNVKFNIDNEWNNYWVIYFWLNMLRDDEEGYYGIFDTSGALNYDAPPPDYQTDMTLYAIDEYDKPMIKWTYQFAFPTNLSEINWDEKQTNEIEASATFQFSQVNCELITS